MAVCDEVITDDFCKLQLCITAAAAAAAAAITTAASGTTVSIRGFRGWCRRYGISVCSSDQVDSFDEVNLVGQKHPHPVIWICLASLLHNAR